MHCWVYNAEEVGNTTAEANNSAAKAGAVSVKTENASQLVRRRPTRHDTTAMFLEGAPKHLFCFTTLSVSQDR
jgi:hypothetical protein